MLFDVLISNMMFFYGLNNYKTNTYTMWFYNTYPMKLGENVWEPGFWVGGNQKMGQVLQVYRYLSHKRAQYLE